MLRGVHAIDHVDVFGVAGAIDLVAGSRARAAAALQWFAARAGSERNQRLEGASLGKIVQILVAHGHRDLALRGVHHGSALETSTVSVTAPTSSFTSRFGRRPTVSSMPTCLKVRNPGAVTVRV